LSLVQEARRSPAVFPSDRQVSGLVIKPCLLLTLRQAKGGKSRRGCHHFFGACSASGHRATPAQSGARCGTPGLRMHWADLACCPTIPA
jgi:hypothetical protein